MYKSTFEKGRISLIFKCKLSVNSQKISLFHLITHFFREVDSDGDEISDDESSGEKQGYRVWYAMEIEVNPLPHQDILKIKCACQVKLNSGKLLFNNSNLGISSKILAKVILRKLMGSHGHGH